jgi:hypothetical protein
LWHFYSTQIDSITMHIKLPNTALQCIQS